MLKNPRTCKQPLNRFYQPLKNLPGLPLPVLTDPTIATNLFIWNCMFVCSFSNRIKAHTEAGLFTQSPCLTQTIPTYLKRFNTWTVYLLVNLNMRPSLGEWRWWVTVQTVQHLQMQQLQLQPVSWQRKASVRRSTQHRVQAHCPSFSWAQKTWALLIL